MGSFLLSLKSLMIQPHHFSSHRLPPPTDPNPTISVFTQIQNLAHFYHETLKWLLSPSERCSGSLVEYCKTLHGPTLILCIIPLSVSTLLHPLDLLSCFPVSQTLTDHFMPQSLCTSWQHLPIFNDWDLTAAIVGVLCPLPL